MDDREKAAEDERATRLRSKLDAMLAEQVREYARGLGLNIAGLTKREEVEDLIERHEYALAGKARLEAMERAEAARVESEPDKRTRVIRELNAEFCRDIPQSGRAGSFTPEKGGAEFGGSYDVADGTYRVVGSDWLFVIKSRKLAEASRATPANRYGGKGVIQIES